MADFIDFTEGQNYLLANGLPGTCCFALSANPVSAFSAATTLATGIGEITGTNYSRQTQAAPTPANGAAAFSQMSFATGAATNWPAAVYSIVLVTVASGTAGRAICAWNLIAGGAARNLAQANTTEQVTPTLSLT